MTLKYQKRLAEGRNPQSTPQSGDTVENMRPKAAIIKKIYTKDTVENVLPKAAIKKMYYARPKAGNRRVAEGHAESRRRCSRLVWI